MYREAMTKAFFLQQDWINLCTIKWLTILTTRPESGTSQPLKTRVKNEKKIELNP